MTGEGVSLRSGGYGGGSGTGYGKVNYGSTSGKGSYGFSGGYAKGLSSLLRGYSTGDAKNSYSAMGNRLDGKLAYSQQPRLETFVRYFRERKSFYNKEEAMRMERVVYAFDPDEEIKKHKKCTLCGGYLSKAGQYSRN